MQENYGIIEVGYVLNKLLRMEARVLRELNKIWKGFARDLGFGYFIRGILLKPGLKHIYRGHDIKIFPIYDTDKTGERITVFKSEVYSRCEYRLRIMPKKTFHRLLEKFNIQRINNMITVNTGCVEIDEQFNIITNDSRLTQEILSNEDIRSWLFMLKNVRISFMKGKKSSEKMRTFFTLDVDGYIVNIMKLEDVLNLYREFMNEMIATRAIEERKEEKMVSKR